MILSRCESSSTDIGGLRDVPAVLHFGNLITIGFEVDDYAVYARLKLRAVLYRQNFTYAEGLRRAPIGVYHAEENLENHSLFTFETIVRNMTQKATVPTARIASAGVPSTGTSSHHQDQERTPRHLSTMKVAVERSHATRNTATKMGDLLLLIGKVLLFMIGV